MKKHIIYGLLLLIFTFPSAIFAQNHDVTWTNLSKCSANGNDLTKTGVNGWTGGAASKNVLPPGQDGWAEMTVEATNKMVYFGLSEYNHNDASGTINYAFAPQANGNLQIYENGGYKAAGGSYSVNDKLKIERVGTTIYFKKNDQVVYTSTTPSSTQLLVDAFIYHSNTSILDAITSFDIPQNNTTGYEIVWTDLVNATTSGNTITATANNGGAASENTILAGTDGWVEMTVVARDKHLEFGLSDINESHTAASIDYRFQLYLNGALAILENSTNHGSFGQFYEDDVLRIERVGTSIHYKKNGVIIYTSTVPSSTDLIADVALVTNGSEVANGRASVSNTSDPCVALGGDVDGDGVCAADDCDDNNPNIPDIPGTICDDGDSTTINDVLLADGCTCMGETDTTNTTQYSFFTPDDSPTDVDIRYSEGKVVIGDEDMLKPGEYNLYVSDGIITELITIAVKNDPTSWADYVFDENYPLLPLLELETYIKTNQHLPNIPTTEEVIKEGINVAEIQVKLLQKIEELTLYVLQQQHEIEVLKKEGSKKN